MTASRISTLPICGPQQVIAFRMQEVFQKNAGEETRALYRKHAMGNSLFRNRGGERL